MGVPGLVATGVKSDFLWLRKSTDGSLIALHTNYEYAMIDLVLPMGGVDKIWYRFVPAVLQVPSKAADRVSLRADMAPITHPQSTRAAVARFLRAS